MTRGDLVVRPAGEGDREAIRSFECPTGPWYEDEAFMPEALDFEENSSILAIRLQVLAIATADQGRVLERGRRLSDALMRTLIAHAARLSVDGTLTAIVARDNLRSIKLCERNGLVAQVAHSIEYVRMFGRFGTGPFSPE